MRILVTGSRNWPLAQQLTVFRALNRATLNAKEVILLHGACPVGTDVPGSLYKGADGLADAHGRLLGWDIRAYVPRPLEGLSRAQQFARRNQAMVDTRPDKVLAFFLQGAPNKGTHMTIDMSRRKNLWVLEYVSG